MNSANRIVDLEVDLGTLGRMIGVRTATGTGTKGIIAPPPVIQFDADRSKVNGTDAQVGDVQPRTVTLREYTTEELVTIHRGRHNLLPLATIIEKTGTDSSRFGASGSAQRGKALHTAEHTAFRRAIVDAVRPLRERYAVAVRGLDNDYAAVDDRAVDIYITGNAAGGFATGAMIPTALDIHEAATQQGLERVSVRPYLIAPSTGNGADFPIAAASCVMFVRQVTAACLKPEIIRDETLKGTRRAPARTFDVPTIIFPTNGKVTMSSREAAAQLAAFDINLRGDGRFSADSYFTDWTSRVYGGQLKPDMIWRSIGHVLIELDPQRANEALDAKVCIRVADHLLMGVSAGAPVLPVNTLAEVTALLDSAERPTGMDIGTDAYMSLSHARYDVIQGVVQDAHAQLQQRVADYEARINSIADQFAQDFGETVGKQVQQAIVNVGLTGSVKCLGVAKEQQSVVAGQFVQRLSVQTEPDTTAYQNHVAQLQELAQRAARRWISTRRETNQMRQFAVEAINMDLVAFESRINAVKMLAGRTVISKMVAQIERSLTAVNTAAAKAQDLKGQADKRLHAMSGGSVRVELPGIVLPTPADTDRMVQRLFDSRIADLAGRAIPVCIADPENITAAIHKSVQREVGNLKLDEVGVIDFIERWPNAIDLEKFVEERTNESWPTAPLDPTVEPGYSPPILRVIRSHGGSQNTGPLMERLRKLHVEEVNQVRDVDYGDPRRIIVSHERRFISHRQFAFLATLEKEAESLLPELEPYLTTCVPDPRLLDEFRCGMVRDESGAWGTFFRAMSRNVVTRKGDNTYLVRDQALRSALHVTDDDGRLAQGLPNIIGRLTNDPTLRRSLDELFIDSLQRDGKNVIVQQYLAAMYAATEYVPANSVTKFTEVASAEVLKLLPACRSIEDAAKLVGFTPPTNTPQKAKRWQREAEKASPDELPAGRHGHNEDGDAQNGHGSSNGNGRRENDIPPLRR